MVEEKELLIGGWYEHSAEWSAINDTKKPPFNFQWTGSCWYALGECTIYLEHISPIPITPEILEKAGFKRQNNGWYVGEWVEYDDNIFGLFDHNLCNGELNLKLNISNGPTPEVKYVHHLQNLYFAMTGEELKIEL